MAWPAIIVSAADKRQDARRTAETRSECFRRRCSYANACARMRQQGDALPFLLKGEQNKAVASQG